MECPLVSVVMPVFNGEDTVSFALSSLLAQTYSNWECIVVDDGSTDDTYGIISNFDDSRIKVYRFGTNEGRPYARQHGLEKAAGQFLAMLDADDWVFTEKLELQVRQFLSDPSLVAVSSGMMITNRDGPVGVRFVDEDQTRTLENPFDLKMPHASTMLKMEAARRCSYNLQMKYSQDMDFLRKVIFSGKYRIMSTPFYSYSEMVSVHPIKVIKSYLYGCLACFPWFSRFPISASIKILKNLFNATIIAVLSGVGLFSLVLRRRSRPVTLPMKDKWNHEFLKIKSVEVGAKRLA